ncbi:MAG: hypothetical protein RQ899_06155 [Pseudomonadales bacterium]|nr:hypothetical protein [Pseudomonadales bacterium]
MAEVVIDTNVLLVADGQHQDISDECLSACIARLEQVKKSSTIVIDDEYRILGEYQHKLSANKSNSVGGVFLKWLLQNQTNTAHVAQVTLTETAQGFFDEFPEAELQAEFDPPDRKFPAVANAHLSKPPILQATDSKWLNWWSSLADSGIRVEFLCPADICRFYEQKFPDNAVPDLP